MLLLQDIIEEDEMKLDWFFKASLIHDLTNVRVITLFVFYTGKVYTFRLLLLLSHHYINRCAEYEDLGC